MNRVSSAVLGAAVVAVAAVTITMPAAHDSSPAEALAPPRVLAIGPDRSAESVANDMAAAATDAGAVDESAYLERLPAADSCRACVGADMFESWCETAGGHLVRPSPAEADVFADAGPIYCYPGRRALPALEHVP